MSSNEEHPTIKFKAEISDTATVFLDTVVYVVVQFYPWFKLYFSLFQTHYHILPYPKTKEKKI